MKHLRKKLRKRKYHFDTDSDVENGITDFDGDVENFDEDFEDFLSKRSRARRKERRKLRKGGMSRKEARKSALAMIPRQKAKEMVQEVASGSPSPSTQKLIDEGIVSGNPSVLAQQVNQAIKENVGEGTQTEGRSGGGTPPPQKAGLSMGMMIGIGAVVIGGLYLIMRKK